MKNNLEIPIQQILSRVKHLEIRARKLVQDTLSSEYHSVFKGRGIELHEVRNYYPEDDVRDIDWNVTARMNEPYVKTYIEERQLTVLFAVDISSSSYFGTKKSKREIMAEISALLGFASFFNNDRAGLILFSEDIERFIPPAKNYSHLLRIIRDIWYFEAKKRGTNLNQSFNSIYHILKKKAIIFILSDFIDTGYEKPLLGLSNRHEVIPIVIHDTFEKEIKIPFSDFIRKLNLPVLFEFEDIESGQIKTVEYKKFQTTEINRIKKYYRNLFAKYGLDYTEVDESTDYFKKIELLLRKRMKKY